MKRKRETKEVEYRKEEEEEGERKGEKRNEEKKSEKNANLFKWNQQDELDGRMDMHSIPLSFSC